MRKVNVEEARVDLAHLVEEALSGEEIVITLEGIPVVQLAPVISGRTRVFGQDRGRIRISPDFDVPDPELERLFEGGGDDRARQTPISMGIFAE